MADNRAHDQGLDEFLAMFEDSINTSDIIAARVLAKLSATIVKKRLELNMTQKRFAEYLGVSQGMVSKWEGSDYNFTVKSLAELADSLDMNLYISLSPHTSDVQIQQMEGENISYVISGPREFTGKHTNKVKYNTQKRVEKISRSDCKIYSFYDREEM